MDDAMRARLYVPSDFLRHFAGMLREFPALRSGLREEVLHFRAVLDASALLRDVVYAASARKPNVRPATEELMDAGVMHGLAPDVVKEEVEKHLPKRTAHLDDDGKRRASEVWARYRAKIEWIAEPEYRDVMASFPELAARDPNDLAIAAVHRASGAHVVISYDNDLLHSTELPAANRVLMHLSRDYARTKANAAMATSVPTLAVGGALALVFEVLSHVPDRFKVVVVLGIIGAAGGALLLMGPQRRRDATAALRLWFDWIAEMQPSAALAEEHATAIRKALPALASVKADGIAPDPAAVTATLTHASAHPDADAATTPERSPTGRVGGRAPKRQAVKTRLHTDATTPKRAKATVPERAKATTPKRAKATTPKRAKATTPKRTKATTPKRTK